MNEKTLRILEFSKITDRLVSFAGSAMAKDQCRKLEPMTDLTQIRRMQEETSAALRRVYQKGSVSFGGVKDLRPSLLRLKIGGSLNIHELMDLASTLETALRVRTYGRRDPQDEERDCLDPLFKLIEPLSPLAHDIRHCILDEDTIADDASPGLKSVRRQIKLTNERIHSQLSSMVSSSALSQKLQDNIITMRSGRYCLPVKAEYRSQVPGMIHDQSSTGATLFIEPMAIVKLNNDLAQLAVKEREEIEHVLEDLSSQAAESQEFIQQDLSILTSLDFIFARALLSRSYTGSEPVFNNTGWIHLKKARHPLLDKKKVVPIDVWLGHRPQAAGGKGRGRKGQEERGAASKAGSEAFGMLIVTGPNTGGKTVSLKTVGLLSLMGQSGLHIPAFEHSELAVFDDIFADIGDEQSIEQSLSTFSAHMTNIVNILDHADENSLVLLDELCAGTDPAEGAALAISILRELLGRGVTTMATTHYSELKVFALDTENVCNASCEFNVDTLSPTYRLLIGLPGKSNAFAISKKLGLPEDIIDDAQKNIDSQQQNFEDLLTDLEQSRVTIERERGEIDSYKEQIEALKTKLENKQLNIDKQKQRILDEAREKARNILQDAKDYADHTIRTMNKLSRGSGVDMKAMEKARSNVREKIDRSSGKKNETVQKNTKFGPEDFKPGETVKVLSMNLKGTIVSKPNAKGELEVQMGILKSRISYTDLLPASDEEEKKLNASLAEQVKSQTDHMGDSKNVNTNDRRGRSGKNGKNSKGGEKTSFGSIGMDKSANAVTSINLIGETVDIAMSDLDKFLDDAYLAHIPSVTIIHGRGTGALRKAVHEKLRRTKYVKSFRLGTFGEGENGVTIVELQ